VRKTITFAHYDDIKGNAKCRNWDGFGGYGSAKVTGNVTIRYSAYDFLFDFNRNYGTAEKFTLRLIFG